MKRNNIVKPTIGVVAATALFAAGLPGAAAAGSGDDFHGAAATKAQYGVIFQLDSGGNAAIKKTLNNIENILHDPRLAKKLKVELIANSHGFDVYVKNNGFEDKLRHLQQQGVILAQCNNTLKELKVSRNDLYPFISIVPSGMGEITIREAEGWAYIHPAAPNPNRL
ncbi:DsrE/DsrF-like family protein [mine drainage metagenome]|uniref:DsrE/DsrF-like family protein n=1 Tax=mine drainage metagenome TaxID=410659 RepID=A0A1J5RPA6_9ZZZZ